MCLLDGLSNNKCRKFLIDVYNWRYIKAKKMAFEDRSSPNTACSPNSSNTNSSNINSPNSPESTRTAQYTCTTINVPILKQENDTQLSPNNDADIEKPSFLRIASFALSNVKQEDNSVNYLTNGISPNRQSENQRRASSNVLTDSEYDCSSDCNSNKSDSCSAPENFGEPVVKSLKYSITNILRPDFGKTAVLKKKGEGESEVSYKPYADTRLISGRTITPILTVPASVPKSSPKAVLGNLYQTVSRIGTDTNNFNESALNNDEPKNLSNAKTLTSEEKSTNKTEDGKLPTLWPAWVYCTRYSDRPSSGPRSRRVKKDKSSDEKRPRTAFSGAQLARLKHEFAENRYLTERRRQQLSQELGLNEAQIKIWFQNKRAKIKKASGEKNPLALQLMAQGLYNHSTVACDEEELTMKS